MQLYQTHLTEAQRKRVDKMARFAIGQRIDYFNQEFGGEMKMAGELEISTEESPGSYEMGIEEDAFLKFMGKLFENKKSIFKNLVEDKLCENHEGVYEVVTKPLSPLRFLSLLRRLKEEISSFAFTNGFQFSFFDDLNKGKFPNLHLNFSFLLKGKNIFHSVYKNLTNFVMNRFIRELKENRFVFSQSPRSFIRFSRSKNSHSPGYLTYAHYVQKEKDQNKGSGHGIFIRDGDDDKKARCELRFADFAGIDSVKVLFVMNSIADTLDYLFKRYPEAKGADNPAEVLNKRLGKDPDMEIYPYVKEPLEKPSEKNKIPNLTEAKKRFKNSHAAKRLLGQEIHEAMSVGL